MESCITYAYPAASHYSMISYADSIDPMYYHPEHIPPESEQKKFDNNNQNKIQNSSTEYHEGQRVWYENNQYEVDVVCKNGMQLESDFASRYITSDNYYKLSKVPPQGLQSLMKQAQANQRNNHEETSTSTTHHENELNKFKKGDTIQLVGLKSKKHWNGKMAIIIEAFMDDKNRWPVELIESKSQALIKPENMKAIGNIFTDETDETDDTDDTDESPPSSNNSETKTMNLCRITQTDFKSLVDDINIDEVVTSLYVRIACNNSEYKVCKITKTIDYPKGYTFMDIVTTKGLTVSYGTKIFNTNLNNISNDDFTDNEIHSWKQRLQECNIQLPTQNTLLDTAETVHIIRKTVELQSRNLAYKEQKSQEPGANIDILSINNHNLKRNNYLDSYFSAINMGCNCFWCIPSAEGDMKSQYVAFLLMKNSKNGNNLIAAQQIAKNQRHDIVFAEIREWTVREGVKKGYWKSKGWLIDCKNEKFACNIRKVLSNFIPHTFGKRTPANFCRIVLQEFGDEYMRVHSLPIEKKPTLEKESINKAFGPKYNYKYDEPTIASMIEHSDEITNGDCDLVSTISEEIEIKYDDFKHMKTPKVSQNERVVYKWEQYEIVDVMDDKIKIENNFSSHLVVIENVNKIL